jgi:hypothetical protein
MSQWSSAKAKRVFPALLRIGWNIKRVSSSHKILQRPGWPDVSCCVDQCSLAAVPPHSAVRLCLTVESLNLAGGYASDS